MRKPRGIPHGLGFSEMTEQDKIILMTKLATYDKYHARSDGRKSEFFRHDYVYRRNLAARFFTLLGSLVVVGFYFLHRMVIDHVDFADMPTVVRDLIVSGIFIVLVQLLYSLLGFVLHSREYNAATERIAEYMENMKALSEMKKGSRYAYYESDDDEYY